MSEKEKRIDILEDRIKKLEQQVKNLIEHPRYVRPPVYGGALIKK